MDQFPLSYENPCEYPSLFIVEIPEPERAVK
jgi:hypothetical protein